MQVVPGEAVGVEVVNVEGATVFFRGLAAHPADSISFSDLLLDPPPAGSVTQHLAAPPVSIPGAQKANNSTISKGARQAAILLPI